MDNYIKNFNLFIDQKGKAGVVTEFTPPKLTLKMDDHLAGGMDAPVSIELGQEKMETSFVLTEYSASNMVLWGMTDGNTVSLTLRAAAQQYNGTIIPVVIQMRGKITGVDEGGFKPAEKVAITYTMSVEYYHKTLDGKSVIEIDVLNMIRKINGVDQLKTTRSALGI